MLADGLACSLILQYIRPTLKVLASAASLAVPFNFYVKKPIVHVDQSCKWFTELIDHYFSWYAHAAHLLSFGTNEVPLAIAKIW